MTVDRRSLLKHAAMLSVMSALPRLARAADEAPAEKADYTLRIDTGLVELSPEHIVSTTLYNGQFPGPLVRLREGQRVVVDIHNDTDTPELVHWHGQIHSQRCRRRLGGRHAVHAAARYAPYRFCAEALRFPLLPYPRRGRRRSEPRHLHRPGGTGLHRAENNPGAYDREVFLVLKEFEPSFSRGGDMAMDVLAGAPIKELQQIGKEAEEKPKRPKGYEVGYELFGINGKMLGQGEPIRVKQGERVLFHVLNASAGEIRSLALPGHAFRIVALDGNPVPTQADVPVLWLGTAERISAIVEMNHPGVWVMGDLADDDRGHGMGIVVEYANAKGKPQWTKPKPFRWDYTLFGKANATPASPDETIEITIVKQNAALNGFNQWTLNGEAFSMETMKPMYTVHEGRRYRLKFRNASDDIHPLHLHRHSFELVRVGGKPTAGVIKDVVMLGGFQEVEIDFVADNPGLTLFHCHQQLHMDFGFMALLNYA